MNLIRQNFSTGVANFVTKKDGTKVPFDIEKIKTGVAAASVESGLSEGESASLAQEISNAVVVSFEGSEEVTSDEIREKILSELDETRPSVSESWRKYEEGKGG